MQEQHPQAVSPTDRRGSDLGSDQAAQEDSAAANSEASPALGNSEAVAGLQATASTQSGQGDRQRQQPPGSSGTERTTADVMPAAQQPAQAAASGLATSAAHVSDHGVTQHFERERPKPQQPASRGGQRAAARSAPIGETNGGTAGKDLPLPGAHQQTAFTPPQPPMEGISALQVNLRHQLPAVDPAVQSRWSGYQPQLLSHGPDTAAGRSQQTWHTTASFRAGLSAGEHRVCLVSCHDFVLHLKNLTANTVSRPIVQCKPGYELAMGFLFDSKCLNSGGRASDGWQAGLNNQHASALERASSSGGAPGHAHGRPPIGRSDGHQPTQAWYPAAGPGSLYGHSADPHRPASVPLPQQDIMIPLPAHPDQAPWSESGHQRLILPQAHQGGREAWQPDHRSQPQFDSDTTAAHWSVSNTFNQRVHSRAQSESVRPQRPAPRRRHFNTAHQIADLWRDSS